MRKRTSNLPADIYHLGTLFSCKAENEFLINIRNMNIYLRYHSIFLILLSENFNHVVSKMNFYYFKICKALKITLSKILISSLKKYLFLEGNKSDNLKANNHLFNGLLVK